VKRSVSNDSARVESGGGRGKDDNTSHLTGKLHIPFAWKVKAGRSNSLIESFYHAFAGISSTLKTERNFRIHLAAATAAVSLGLFLHIGSVQWLALVGAIGLVLTAEFINTAIEHMVDLVTERTYHDAAKAAKDTAAAAVLMASACAVITGFIIFLPPIINLLR